MKKLSLLALTGILGFALTACGGNEEQPTPTPEGDKIEFNKAYLSGEGIMMTFLTKTEVKLQKGEKCWFDLTFLDKAPEIFGGKHDQIFDQYGTYTYNKDTKNYKFVIELRNPQTQEVTTEEWDTTYDAAKNEHAIADYYRMVEGEAVEFPLTGLLPIL